MNIFSRSSSPRIQIPQSVIKDELARESDVTVSNINSSSSGEYTGFTIYILSSLTLLVYICWSLMPEKWLHSLSINYYPNTYWALAIPSYSLMLMVFIYVFLALYNTEILTLPLNHLNTILDENSQFPNENNSENLIQDSIEYVHKAPSGVWDLPITLVNEVLYGE